MLRLATVVAAAMAILVMMVSVAGGVGGVTVAATPEPEKPPEPIYVVAPIGGIFWHGEYPGGQPFVDVGEQVKHSTVVAKVEHMRMFAITAGCEGTITEIYVTDGQLVTAMQPLMKIIPKAVKSPPVPE